MRHWSKIICLLLFCQILSGQHEKSTLKQTDSTRFKYTYPDYFFEEPSWRISVPVWVPGFRGSFAYGDVEIDPEFENEPPRPPDAGDKLRQSKLSIQFYLLLNLSYRYKKLFIEADGMKATLSNDIYFTNADKLRFRGTIDGTIIRGIAGYRFLERRYPEKLLKWSLEAYAGIRFFDIHVFADRIDLLDIRQDWIDPIVGIRVPVAYKRWMFSLQGDYGGISGADHYSFFASLNASYHFSKSFGLGLGWAYQNAAYDGKLKDVDLKLGIELTGPAVRFIFSF